MQTGVELNPLGNNFRYAWANVLYGVGRAEEALSAYRKARRLEPPVPWGLLLMAQFLMQRGWEEEAFGVVRQWGKVVGYPDPERLPVVLRAVDAKDLTEDALAVLEDVVRTTGLRAVDLVGLYVNLSAPAESMRIVQEAIAERHPGVILLVLAQNRTKVMENPEIMAALQEVGMPFD